MIFSDKESDKPMPVDASAITEMVKRIFGKNFPVTADPHGHIGADWREHAAKQISEEFHH